MLTGTFTHERFANLPDDDWRRKARQFQEPRFSANLKLAESLRPIAERNNRSLAELAIAWVLRRPEVSAAIVGARHPSQIEETVGASDWVLSDADITEIEAILDERERSLEE